MHMLVVVVAFTFVALMPVLHAPEANAEDALQSAEVSDAAEGEAERDRDV